MSWLRALSLGMRVASLATQLSHEKPSVQEDYCSEERLGDLITEVMLRCDLDEHIARRVILMLASKWGVTLYE